MEKETKFCSTVDVCLAGKKNNEKRKNEVCLERERKRGWNGIQISWLPDFAHTQRHPEGRKGILLPLSFVAGLFPYVILRVVGQNYLLHMLKFWDKNKKRGFKWAILHISFESNPISRVHIMYAQKVSLVQNSNSYDSKSKI